MRTYRLGYLRGLASLIALLVLAACGGGGGDEAPGLTPVVYTGSTSPAAITAANASQLTADVVGSDDAASTIVGAAIETGAAKQDRANGAMDLALRLNRGFRNAVLGVNDARRVAPAVQVNQTEPCDNGVGSIRTTGTLNDASFTGTLTVSFNNCLIDGDTLNGPATMRVDAFSFAFPQGIPSDSTLSFVRLTIRGPGVSVDTTGNVRLQLDFGMNSETVTSNLDSLNNNTGLTSRVQNLVFTSAYNNIFTPTSFAASISGKVFDHAHGYVEIATVAPLAFATLGQLFPDSGQLELTGAGNRKIRASALSSTLARLELDLDGNSAYEIDVRLKWADLSGPAGADLADNDGDGMHNGWEMANALNKDDSADATLDNDGDGARSFIEYLAGTDPNSAISIPPLPGQAISLPDNSNLVFDSVSQRIYAAVRGNPGTITPIDPMTGKFGTAIPVGIDPVKLARSDNGQFLYVGLDGEPVVQRINLATQTVDLTLPLGSNSNSEPLFVDDMEVLPGSPQSIAVARKRKLLSPRHQGVAIYDDGVQRATATTDFIGSNVIEFSAVAGTLYGYSTESVPSGFFRMTVDGSGVSVLDVTQNLINDLGNIEFDADFIYSTGGSVINPQTLATVGSFAGLPGIPFSISVRPDSGSNRVFFLVQTPQERIAQTATISAFDLNTRQAVGSKSIPGVVGDPDNLIRWGAKGLAFRTNSGQIYLIESASLFP